MNVIRAALRYGGWACLLTLVLAGGWHRWQAFRSMPPIIVERMVPYGIEFDADFEAQLNSGKPMPTFVRQTLESNRQYVDTLSQPIAITRWQGDASTWEVFFATNRDVIDATADSGQARFGNDVLLTSPHYGRAEITVPFRRRGVDPNRDQASASAADSPAMLSFDEIKKLPWETVAEGLRSQVARSRQHDLLLFVHGFNVDFESALIRTAQLGLDTPFNGAIVAYSWPSQGGVGNYSTDEPINANSVAPFSEFLKQLIAAVPEDTRINIVVHSMGNRLVLKAISQLDPPQGRQPIANLVLCAPDVGLAEFQQWARKATAQCRRVTLYASRSDSALIASKQVHYEQRAGDAHPPVCVSGVETIDVSSVDFDLLLGHSYYGSNLDVLSDLYFVLKEDRPAAKRGYLTREPLSDGSEAYWRFADRAPLHPLHLEIRPHAEVIY